MEQTNCKKPRFVIEKCSLITQWAWDTTNDCCPICRNSINEDSITNENDPDVNSVVVVGTCGHAFHYDCISRWLKTSKYCPLCNGVWEYQKTMDKKVAEVKTTPPVSNQNSEIEQSISLPSLPPLSSLPPINVTSNNLEENINNLGNVPLSPINPISNNNSSFDVELGPMASVVEESIIDDDSDDEIPPLEEVFSDDEDNDGLSGTNGHI